MKIKRLIFLLLLFPVTVSVLGQQREEAGSCSKKRSALNPLQKSMGVNLHPDIFGYDVNFYFLDIELSNTSTYIKGSVRIDAHSTQALLDTFVFELIPSLAIDSLKVNGQLKSVARSGDEVYVPGIAIASGNPVSVQIWYHGNPSTGGGFFSGISTGSSPTWGAQATWTLSEPFNAKQWWPVKQVLEDKADSAWIFITTQSTNKAGSNGLLTAVTPMPGNKLRYEWKTRYPINYYLISATVSTYVDYSIYAHPNGTQDSILIQNYVYSNPNTLPYFKSVIDQTAGLIELYSDKFGIYPFAEEKYGHCMAPMGGGMEHQTMTTLGSFSFGLVAHELGHMWFGDLVTCGTWQDIWINEGFASYSEYISAQYLKSYADAQYLMADVHSNVKSQPGGSVYVPLALATDVNRIFSGRLSYDKGSALVHMIRFELGDDQLFFDVLKTFLSTYAHGVATGDDFRGVAETLSGKSFQHFFDQWYYGEGYPSFQVRWAQLDPQTVRVITLQSTSTTVTPLFKMPLEFRFVSPSGGDTTVRLYVQNLADTFFVNLNRIVTSLQVDPEKWMLADITSVKNTTGMEEIRRLPMAIFPNPARDHLTLRYDGMTCGEITWQLFDMNGRQVMSCLAAGTGHTIDISALSPGMYHWQAISGDGYNNGKLMVQ